MEPDVLLPAGDVFDEYIEGWFTVFNRQDLFNRRCSVARGGIGAEVAPLNEPGIGELVLRAWDHYQMALRNP